MISVAGGVDSVRDPSMKNAMHSTPVPLYSDLAGKISVYTIVPFSLIEPVVMSGKKSPGNDPFTNQPMIASDDV